jgi:hypothetical protein
MELPDIIHPKSFLINGYAIRVAAYMALTDQQAAKIAMHCYRSRKWLKKDLKKIHTQMWIGSREDLAMLG